MPEIDSSVKAITDSLRKLDALLDQDEFSGTQGITIYEQIYRSLLNPSNSNLVNSKGELIGIGHGIAMIPGTEKLPCEETLLVCLFPVFHDLGEEYPNDILELRMTHARAYMDACPSLRNIIFYGPVWDSILWKMHRDSFSNCTVYLKLFFSDYTRLKHKKR